MRYPRLDLLWVTDQPNALAPASLELVRNALEQSAVIFGFHALFYGGSGGSWWAVATVADYLSLVRSARPGDFFETYALDPLVQAGYALAGAHIEPGQWLSSRLFDAERYRQIEAHTQAGGWIAVVWWTQATSEGERECGMLELGEDFAEDMDSELARFESAAGALYVFRTEELMRPETIWFAGKRPNESGETPIGGAY